LKTYVIETQIVNHIIHLVNLEDVFRRLIL
jgi:hypothetical protein